MFYYLFGSKSVSEQLNKQIKYNVLKALQKETFYKLQDLGTSPTSSNYGQLTALLPQFPPKGRVSHMWLSLISMSSSEDGFTENTEVTQ